MEVIIQRDYDQMSKAAAQLVVEVLNTKPNAVLGMATGFTSPAKSSKINGLWPKFTR